MGLGDCVSSSPNLRCCPGRGSWDSSRLFRILPSPLLRARCIAGQTLLYLASFYFLEMFFDRACVIIIPTSPYALRVVHG
jgi:hypothetical protein